MKISLHISAKWISKAFTIVEVMVALSIFSLVMGGILYSHIMGLKMYQLVQAKMGASSDARSAINLLVFEVQSADKVVVGNGSSNSFVQVATNALHVGNAIQIYLTTNTNNSIRYFLVTNGSQASKLYRITNGASSVGTLKLIAENITNYPTATHPTPPSPFALEYFQGGAVTDEQPDKQMVLSLDFIFYQLQYPIVQLGSNRLFDYYEFRTKITPRIH